jgi:ribosomal protein L37AE/L43A
MDYEETDKSALKRALLALRTCPNCRADLQPVALLENVWGCHSCKETWHLEPEETKCSA